MNKGTFNFSEEVKAEAAARQDQKCGSCGDPLSDEPTQAHHTGITAQEARAWGLEEKPDYVKSVDNCTILHEQCHFQFAHDGNKTRTATEDTSAMTFTHGGDLEANRKLAQEHEVARENSEAQASSVNDVVSQTSNFQPAADESRSENSFESQSDQTCS